MAKIGYAGSEGSYTQLAITEFLSRQHKPQNKQFYLDPAQCQQVAHTSISHLFTALRSSSVDYALVPCDNSYSGAFVDVYNALLKSTGVFIVAECVVQEKHVLMRQGKSANAGKATPLYAHSHTLAQCQEWLDIHAAEFNVHSVDDISSFLASHKDSPDLAVIAAPELAKIHSNLQIADEQVSDTEFTVTRFLLLSRTALTSEQLSHTQSINGGNKLSLAVALTNKHGALVKALQCFSLRDISVLKIESRPSPRVSSSFAQMGAGNVWECVNFLDIEGGITEPRVKNALTMLEEFSNSVKVFGCYPKSLPSVTDASTTVRAFGM